MASPRPTEGRRKTVLMTAPRQTAGRKTRRFAVSGDPERSISLVLCTCGFRISASRVHRAQVETGPGHRAFPVAEIFSARAWNDLPRRPQNEGSRPHFGWAEAWHASWIRGDRDAPGGLPSLSPRHGLPIARRHRGTYRCLRAPVGPLPSTRVPAWPYGTVAGKDDAAGCRKRTDSADDAAGSRTGRDDAAGRCIKDEAAGRRKIKDEAAGCRTGPATAAGPVAGSPSTQLQGTGRTRTRREAVRSQSRWRLRARMRGGAGRASDRPRGFSDRGGRIRQVRVHAPSAYENVSAGGGTRRSTNWQPPRRLG